MRQPTQRIHVGRLPVDVVTFKQALAAIGALVDGGRGGSVFTPNVDHVVQAETNEAFFAAYSRVDLSLADGAPIIWASRALRTPLPERVSGADLVLPVLALAAQRGWRVAFLGAEEGVAARAATIVHERFGTNVVSVSSPRVDVNDGARLDDIVAGLRETQPHLLLVALGAPKQELLIDRIAPRLGAAVCLGIGAGLDFVAGTVRRAPAVLREHGLEWAYRLSQEPGRLWRRYLVQDPKFAFILARDLLRAPAA